MIAYIILLIIFISLLVIYLQKSSKAPCKNFPPGPPKLPIWGSYWFLLKENYKFMHLSCEKLAKRYNTNILGIYLGDFPTVVTMDYELSKELLTRDEFAGRIDSVLVRSRSDNHEPKGVLFTDGPLWKSHRRFSLRHMRDYGFGRRSDVVENHLSDEINTLIKFLHTEPSPDDMAICKQKGLVRLSDIFYCTLINTVLLVISSNHYDYKTVVKYCKAAENIAKCFDATGNAVTITPWLRYIAPKLFNFSDFDKNNKILYGFIKKQVDEHIETFSSDHLRDFIDDFIYENMQQGTELDDAQLIITIIDYMIPAPVASSQTLSVFCSLLVNYPDVQKKLQDEIDEVVGRSKLPTLDDRQNLPYFEATLREVFRFVPMAPLSFPRRCVEDTTLGGYFIPKDTVMLPNVWTALKDPTVFSNPDEFRPERFLNPDGSVMRKDYTLNFGGGKRLCVGETFSRSAIFLVMTNLLHNFSIKSSNGKQINVKDLDWGLTMSIKETWVQFVPRD